MSKFYGTIQGNRGMATRGGSKNSGFKASAQSFDGSVIVRMNYDDNNQLRIHIDLADDSRGSFGDTYFAGTLAELKECFASYSKGV